MNLAVIRKSVIGLLLMLSISSSVLADTATIIKKLSAVVPDLTPENITETPVKGLYQVMVGSQVVYVSGDGKYLLQGELINLDTRENLSQTASNNVRKTKLAAFNEKEMIVFRAKDEKHQITVFSDIDCVYCRKLHAGIDDYLDAGITVRYLFYPRSGPNTDSYFKAISVWCATDRNEALTEAKLNNNIVNKTCDNPVDEHMALAAKFGITGTPAIITSSGKLIPGYVPAKHLIKELN